MNRTNISGIVWVVCLLAILGLATAVLVGVVAAQEETETPTPEKPAVEAVVDDDLRVRSYMTRSDGTMRIILESDERQDVVISEVVDNPGSGSQKFAIRAITAPSDGKRSVTLPASGGATIVTRECRDRGSCVFLPPDEGGDLWPDKGRDALSAGVTLVLVIAGTFGIARRKRRNPHKDESAHDTGGRL